MGEKTAFLAGAFAVGDLFASCELSAERLSKIALCQGTTSVVPKKGPHNNGF
jgi:hypothetical protein